MNTKNQTTKMFVALMLLATHVQCQESECPPAAQKHPFLRHEHGRNLSFVSDFWDNYFAQPKTTTSTTSSTSTTQTSPNTSTPECSDTANCFPGLGCVENQCVPCKEDKHCQAGNLQFICDKSGTHNTCVECTQYNQLNCQRTRTKHARHTCVDNVCVSH